VDRSIPLSINWELSRYDVIVIDEISMISEDIFEHILSTFQRLIFRPVLVLAGDGGQQQPFTQIEGRSKTLTL
jgi:ATP-dependent exoDNAse (exonuclease V) alpha subunit